MGILVLEASGTTGSAVSDVKVLAVFSAFTPEVVVLLPEAASLITPGNLFSRGVTCEAAPAAPALTTVSRSPERAEVPSGVGAGAVHRLLDTGNSALRQPRS